MRLLDFAVKVSLKEKGKKQVNIAQLQEVLKIALNELANMGFWERFRLLRRYKWK